MKYLVSAEVTISVVTEVEAASATEAEAAASDYWMPSLCHQCAQAGKDEDETWSLTGELDGEPRHLTAREMPKATP